MYAFRNYQVAAPLKLLKSMLDAAVSTSLPQLSSCGPIEAKPMPLPTLKNPTFRNYQVAAPLKRWQVRIL